jgi:hypothetical protein
VNFDQLAVAGECYDSLVFVLLCYWDFLHYRSAIKGNEEDRQHVLSVMNQFNLNNGTELLDLMLKLANILLNYKLWFLEIKKYRRFRSRLIPPKGICFSGFFNPEEDMFAYISLVPYTPVMIDTFKVHKKPLKVIRTKNSGKSLYERNAEWNMRKWW